MLTVNLQLYLCDKDMCNAVNSGLKCTCDSVCTRCNEGTCYAENEAMEKGQGPVCAMVINATGKVLRCCGSATAGHLSMTVVEKDGAVPVLQ